jgi:hypothetical protein
VSVKAIAALALAGALVTAAGAAVERGTITANRGAAGITLGMTRTSVVAKLGAPVYENLNGYMQYSNANLFDVYLDSTTKRVRLIGVSGRQFCLRGPICLLAKGGIPRLKARYGKALRLVTTETGEHDYVLLGRFGGRRVFTSFMPAPEGRILQVFIGYCPAPPAVCGS